ncbi:MAG: response regulator [Planctomycetia bacterium]|nr:response regulator [Planctomycetia bacterium]MCC7314269.1 response regulator [Planctomycetota bacterium]OQZ06926.1 MAG: regulator [Planctomycetes bacterium UTPLA1]
MYPRKPLDERQAVAEALAAEGPEWRVKSVFTTGEVAEICKISQQTVIRCFDSGRLKGFRVPGSKFRRVPRAELIRFMKTNEIPIENLDSGKRRVLIVDDDPAIVDMLVDIIGRDGRFEVKAASNGFDAGALTKEFRPDVVLLDFMLPDINGNVVCQRIKSDPELAHTKIIIVSGAVAPAEIDTLKAAGADEFIQKPFDIARLIESIADLVAA